jgi:hypothetical protein
MVKHRISPFVGTDLETLRKRVVLAVGMRGSQSYVST